jgi:hypothetical protein
MSSYGAVSVPQMRANRSGPLRKKMKLTLRQKLRNWLMNDSEEDIYAPVESIGIETPSLDSNGFRLQVYKANGGIVVETRSYDRRRDESNNGLYVITDDKDLGAEISKIITMENLKG